MHLHLPFDARRLLNQDRMPLARQWVHAAHCTAAAGGRRTEDRRGDKLTGIARNLKMSIERILNC